MPSKLFAINFVAPSASYAVVAAALKIAKKNCTEKKDTDNNVTIYRSKSVANIFDKIKFFDISNRPDNELLKKLCTQNKIKYAFYSSFEKLDDTGNYQYSIIFDGEEEVIIKFLEVVYKEYERQIRKIKADERRKRRQKMKEEM